MSYLKTLFIKWAYKADTGKIYWEKVISSVVVLFGLLAFMIYRQRKVEENTGERNKFPGYTIGLTTGTNDNIRGSKIINYKYFVNQTLYNTWNSYPVLMKNIGTTNGRYFVKFSKLDPSNAEMLFDHPVPNSINEVPDSGLVELPDIK